MLLFLQMIFTLRDMCTLTRVLANACDTRYRFRKSALEAALESCNVGDIDVVLQLLQDLELVFPLHKSDDAEASGDTLFAVPGRLAHNDVEAVVKQFEAMRSKAWRDAAADGHHVGVRLTITNSSLILPPSTFSRLMHHLSTTPGFEMWRHGARTTRELTGGGHVSVEGLIDLDDSLQFVDVVARSEVKGHAALKSCVDHLQHVVATCE